MFEIKWEMSLKTHFNINYFETFFLGAAPNPPREEYYTLPHSPSLSPCLDPQPQKHDHKRWIFGSICVNWGIRYENRFCRSTRAHDEGNKTEKYTIACISRMCWTTRKKETSTKFATYVTDIVYRLNLHINWWRVQFLRGRVENRTPIIAADRVY